MITVPNEYQETVSPQSSLSNLLQTTTPITEFRISLQGCSTSLNGGMETQKTTGSATLTVTSDPKSPQKNKTREISSSKSPSRKFDNSMTLHF